MALLGLDLAIPGHATLNRRAEILALPRLQPDTAPVHRSWTARVCGSAGGGKRGIGDALRSRTKQHRATEVVVAVHVLKRMLGLGRPEHVRLA